MFIKIKQKKEEFWSLSSKFHLGTTGTVPIKKFEKK
jgi:hypothetical protein